MINASYNLEGTVLDNIKNIKYLGITITKDLKWNTHVYGFEMEHTCQQYLHKGK